jgi:hypothetical protein
MAADLNSGFSNNINIVTVRTQGVSLQKLTDRSIDLDGDGNKEQISITHVSGHAVGTPSAPGGKIRETVTTPAGFNRTIVQQPVETDGGVNITGSEFTEGVD